MSQDTKFYTGDVVKARKHWGNRRQTAVVMGCYRDLHCGDNDKDYALEFPDDRQSWFQANELELVEAAETGAGMKLLKKWRSIRYAEKKP